MRFRAVDTHAKQLCFLKCNLPEDQPSEIVHRMLSDMQVCVWKLSVLLTNFWNRNKMKVAVRWINLFKLIIYGNLNCQSVISIVTVCFLCWRYLYQLLSPGPKLRRLVTITIIYGHRGVTGGFYPYLSFDILIAIGWFSAGELPLILWFFIHKNSSIGIFAAKRLYIDFSCFKTALLWFLQAKMLLIYAYNTVFTTHVKIAIYQFWYFTPT